MSFREDQIAHLAASGWSRCGSVAQTVADAGLPAITAQYLGETVTDEQWATAENLTTALEDRFRDARFADDSTYGVLLVPDPARLDTRQPMSAEVRRDQFGRPLPDVFDSRLPAGTAGIAPGRDWTLVATITGRSGISLGSYEDVAGSPAGDFTVNGYDTRTLMIRQVWGARVLQRGTDLPDCELNDRWTFTLFVGEDLTDGCAESGTILKGKVRFRLGKPDRGIGSARVAPAIAVR